MKSDRKENKDSLQTDVACIWKNKEKPKNTIFSVEV